MLCHFGFFFSLSPRSQVCSISAALLLLFFDRPAAVVGLVLEYTIGASFKIDYGKFVGGPDSFFLFAVCSASASALAAFPCFCHRQTFLPGNMTMFRIGSGTNFMLVNFQDGDFLQAARGQDRMVAAISNRALLILQMAEATSGPVGTLTRGVCRLRDALKEANF